MTDRELLELAAKAAGMEGWTWCKEDLCMRSPPYRTNYGNAHSYWSPLTDDGAALRLAVKLRLTIQLDDPDASMAGIAARQMGAPTLDGEGPWFWKEWNRDSSDPYAVTRRAIVRAAAEIGRGME